MITKFISVLLVVLLTVGPAMGAEQHGLVKFAGLPVPGASVTATQNGKTLSVVTDQQGAYSFADLADGPLTLEVQMSGFSPVKQDIAAGLAPPDIELKMLGLAEIGATVKVDPKVDPAPVAATAPTARNNAKGKNAPRPAATNTASAFQRTDLNASAAPAASSEAAPAVADASAASSPELNNRAADGLLINGSVNNGASSPFAQFNAFGNNRRGPRSLYSGNLGLTLDNSAFDARSFSLTGQDTVKPDYNKFQGMASFGGPLRIPRLLTRNGPNVTLNYQWVHNRNANIQSALMPTAAQRSGILSTPVFDPSGGLPFANNTIPQSRISPQARALLGLYPLPNFESSSRFNYQIPVVGAMHQDSMQARSNKSIGRKNQLSGSFAMQSTRNDSPNIFGFQDKSRSLGMNSNVAWRHSFNPRLFINTSYTFSRQTSRSTPNFANQVNVSGLAGITGNNQEPINWGPPGLSFSSGIQGLYDGQFSFNRNQTNGLATDGLWARPRHNITYGADFRRQQFNQLSQQDPRGNFTFTGAAAGSDFGGFLLGVPDTTSIAFGNADKYFRSNIWDAFVNDDWRVRSGLTINVGIRWEYNSPISERQGRLVNLAIAPGFTSIAPVVTSRGSLQPDKNGFAPRFGFAWRPLPASSMVVRGGYGIYNDTSVYQSIANQMAQQSPLSKSIRVSNSAANPLTLASGFVSQPGATPNTFAIDPNFRMGYSQNWQLSVQRDLPFALQMTATYLGIKGTRGAQQFLPHTYPAGAVNPCSTCPAGYAYVVSNGNSTREAGQIQLRRRLRSGFTSELSYTFAKAIDDAAMGGRGPSSYVIAQDWLNLGGERGLSNFDQRHVMSLQSQYTSGMGLKGGTLLGGWRGTLLKEWTFGAQFNAGSGQPLTPVYSAAVRGTGVTGSIRPDYTGASVSAAPSGLHLNPAAYAPPRAGQWGNAGRNSITGPSQFTMNASMGRTFRITDRFNADFRIDAANALNHVTFPNWNTTTSSAQFGLPNSANSMRVVQTTIRVRF